MKKLNYITILFDSLLFCVNTYAQDTDSAATSTEAQSDSSADSTEAQSDSSAATTTTVTSNYSSSNGNFSFSTVNTPESVVHTVKIDVPEGSSANTMEMLNALANKVAKQTEDDEASKSLLATLLAIIQAIDTMIDQGTFPATITEDFTMDLTKSLGSDSADTKVDISLGDTSYTAEVKTIQNEDGSYTVVGKIGDTSLDINVVSTEDSYILTGEAGGEEVKSTVSNQVDASASLVNSVVETKDADGNVINTKVSVNNADGTHTVTETNADGVTTTTTYEGNTTTPYDDSMNIATPSIVEDNLEQLGGVGSDTVYKDPTSDTTFEEVEVPDSTIVTPEEFVTPES